MSDTNAILIIDGQAVTISADWQIWFVNRPDGPASAVLYYRGRRVTKRWQLVLTAACAEDRNSNANTADLPRDLA